MLDEIEKAHPDVFNILLQILDDGKLTDSQGNTVSFENTIIIMTSNAGSNLNSNAIGFNHNGYSGSKTEDALKSIFRPEFLNRVDEIIIFNSLTTDELIKIIDLLLKETSDALSNKEITLEVTSEAKQYILAKGTDLKYGARPLRRAIQRYVEDEIADMLLKGSLLPYMHLVIDCKDNTLTFNSINKGESKWNIFQIF